MSTSSESMVGSDFAPPAPNVLVFTDAAAGKVGELIREEANPGLKLRVFVSGGGCSGFQYVFDIEQTRADDDLVVSRDGASVIVDPVSLELLEGSELDFVDDLMGQAFKVKNPNAKTTCGCGSSFSA